MYFNIILYTTNFRTRRTVRGFEDILCENRELNQYLCYKFLLLKYIFLDLIDNTIFNI